MLFVNASPSTIADPGLLDLRTEFPDRLVVEITEQEAVEDYDVPPGLPGRLPATAACGWQSTTQAPAIRAFAMSSSCHRTT